MQDRKRADFAAVLVSAFTLTLIMVMLALFEAPRWLKLSSIFHCWVISLVIYSLALCIIRHKGKSAQDRGSFVRMSVFVAVVLLFFTSGSTVLACLGTAVVTSLAAWCGSLFAQMIDQRRQILELRQEILSLKQMLPKSMANVSREKAAC